MRGRGKRVPCWPYDHINRLAKRYIGPDKYLFRAPGEVRLKFAFTPDKVRHQKQG